MTEKDILGLKPASRLEQIGEIRSKQVDDRKHRIGDALILFHRANPAGSNFGNHGAQTSRLLCWIAPSAETYGIQGTPEPGKVSKTESHD
jgi:lipoprotein-anchoring transpeptidase ErfK/SrfK